MDMLEDIVSIIMFIFVISLIYCLHGGHANKIDNLTSEQRKIHKDHDNPLVLGKDVSLNGKRLR